MGETELKVEIKPGARLQLELGTHMKMTLAEVDVPVKCVFCGMDVDRCLIVRLPKLGAAADNIFPGNQVTVRYVSFGTVFGFETDILGVFYKPSLRYLFLAYPSSVEVHNLRHDIRVDSYIPARASWGGRDVEGAILDLGLGGLRFTSSELSGDAFSDLAMEDKMTISAHLLGLAEEKTFHCQVRSIGQEGHMTTLGLAFENLSQDLASVLASYVGKVSEYVQEKNA
jgi:hypothetical protein